MYNNHFASNTYVLSIKIHDVKLSYNKKQNVSKIVTVKIRQSMKKIFIEPLESV